MKFFLVWSIKFVKITLECIEFVAIMDINDWQGSWEWHLIITEIQKIPWNIERVERDKEVLMLYLSGFLL